MPRTVWRYRPSKKDRAKVVLAKSNGWSDERIAFHLKISRTTLVKHFSVELARGADMITMELVTRLFEAAEAGKVSAIKKLFEMMMRAGR